ncbi:C2H2 zinc finger domain containing protein, putative [Babesia bigemina]|uniref:C2H2 zinc finger domain containing protein, putative n=1 Tax=Babesia bigemina TaxID=5866 RepID=A0A061D6N3_BABBI|nr:C2H2 zinc finger domain containing protein, putative [Babesia bigemina]CDR96341.1 C2H2 zinc finger domain containing protein, putative [Babesia bigemina]|eukprot:XP_012768527.1 C2H2 zinc finger domain containing protein, putative [Babesia bigemina]
MKRSRLLQKSYGCDSCGKSYSRSDHLKRHIRSHGRSRTQFVCGVDGCQRSYVNHEACLEHRAMHIRKLEDGHIYVKGFLVEKHIAEDVTSFVCPVQGCNKLYQSYGGISRHIARNHSGSLICGIDGCTRSFENKEPLEEHRKKHEQQSDPGICYIKGYAVKKIDKEDGTVLICPFEACSSSCHSTSGMTKHISRHISQSSLVDDIAKEPPAFLCPHEGCGRIFTKVGVCIRSHDNFLCDTISYRIACHAVNSTFCQ